jgi:septal ring-binding cell division protein DamX
LAVKTEAALSTIVKAHNSLSHRDIASYQTFYNGEKAFPLLWGIYQTRPEALIAIEKLPDKLKTFYPLIRQISAIHQSIQSNGPD